MGELVLPILFLNGRKETANFLLFHVKTDERGNARTAPGF
jgi:hypothetical protein